MAECPSSSEIETSLKLLLRINNDNPSRTPAAEAHHQIHDSGRRLNFQHGGGLPDSLLVANRGVPAQPLPKDHFRVGPALTHQHPPLTAPPNTNSLFPASSSSCCLQDLNLRDSHSWKKSRKVTEKKETAMRKVPLKGKDRKGCLAKSKPGEGSDGGSGNDDEREPGVSQASAGNGNMCAMVWEMMNAAASASAPPSLSASATNNLADPYQTAAKQQQHHQQHLQQQQQHHQQQQQHHQQHQQQYQHHQQQHQQYQQQQKHQQQQQQQQQQHIQQQQRQQQQQQRQQQQRQQQQRQQQQPHHQQQQQQHRQQQLQQQEKEKEKEKSASEAFAEELSKEDKVYPLKRRSARFPDAKYFCRLCEFHCMNDADCLTHIRTIKHQWRKEIAAAKDKLRKLPTPTLLQLRDIEDTVERVYKEHGLTKAEIQIRKKFVQKVEQFLQEDIKGVKLHLYGSVQSEFGLKSSDLNIDLETPPDMKLANGLKMTYESLKKSDLFKDVEKDFLAKVPLVYFRSNDKHQLYCQITVNSILARQTSQLLGIYSSIDIRAKKLAVAFRYWAKLCRVDRQQEGTLPAYCTYLMTVYFLQRIPNPILPVYHPRATDEKQRERFFETITKAASTFPVKNPLNVGELWLEMLKFYCQGFDSSSTVISINYENKLTRVAKNWKTKRLAIEDPFSTKRNIARSVSGRKIFEYFQDCLVKTCLYFGFPPTCNSSNSSPKKNNNEQQSVGSLTTTTVATTQMNGTDQTLKDPNCKTPSPNSLTQSPSKGSDDKTTLVNDVHEPVQQSTQSTGSSQCSEPDDDDDDDDDDDNVNCSGDTHTSSLQRSPNNEGCAYVFSVENLSDGKGPAKVCSICEKEGHLKNDCPEEKLPPLLPLPPMTEESLKLLNEMLMQIPKDLGPTDLSTEDREKIVKGLECLIREWYPEARLHLFGSSCNGFGFQNSDLDICITFCNHQNADDLDCVCIIESLAQKLRENKQLYGVVAITTAKVPIVKFKLKNSNLEGDISLYNTLAQHNTKLLKLYTEIDQRVAILGYALKVFAKVCEIGDASKGSLSSYAYILMLLHYLQQCDPPVIPVLQELYEGEKPVHLVDSWNAWFFEDLANLKNTWKYCGQNKQSVAELWIGLFVFYTEKFDVQMVVTIRQHSQLTKLEKLWNGKCLAIEDPFDINHNLGAGLSRKMNNYILKTFINGRNVYGTPISQIPPNYETLGDFYFDANRLKEGKPPTDRCCHACGKIGHILVECPMKRSKRNKENNNSNKQDASQQKRDNMAVNRGDNWGNSHHQRPLQPSPLVPNAAHDGSNQHHHIQHHHHHQQKQQQQHHQQLQQQYHQQQQRHHQQQLQQHHQKQQQQQQHQKQQQHYQQLQQQQQHHLHQQQQQQHLLQQQQQKQHHLQQQQQQQQQQLQQQQQHHHQQPQQHQQQQQKHQQLHPGSSYPNMYNMNYVRWPTDKNMAVQQFPSTTVVSSHLQPISSMVPSSHSCHPVSGPERAMTMLKPATPNKNNHQPVLPHRPNVQGSNTHSYQNQHMYLNTRHDQNRRDYSVDDLKGSNLYLWDSHSRQQQY